MYTVLLLCVQLEYRVCYAKLHHYMIEYVTLVLEITVGHWPFADQFQHLAD